MRNPMDGSGRTQEGNGSQERGLRSEIMWPDDTVGGSRSAPVVSPSTEPEWRRVNFCLDRL